MKKQDLIIWLLDGDTMKFENVRELVSIRPPSRECIEFMYDGISTERTRKATFFVKDIMGYAFSCD